MATTEIHCTIHDITFPSDMSCPKCLTERGVVSYVNDVTHESQTLHNLGASAQSRAQSIRLHLSRIGSNLEAMGRLLREARENEDWFDLGYDSWTAYLDGEYEVGRRQLYRAMEVSEVSEALGKAVTQRQAAALTTPEKRQAVREMIEEGADLEDAIEAVTPPAPPPAPTPTPAPPRPAPTPDPEPAPPRYKVLDAEPEWSPSPWFRVITELPGFVRRKAASMEKAEAEFAAICDASQVDRAKVMEAFATSWPMLQASYGHTDPVASLRRNIKRTILDVQRASVNKETIPCVCAGCGHRHYVTRATPQAVVQAKEDRLAIYRDAARGG